MFMNFLSFLLWPVYPNQAIKTIKTNWPKIHFHNLASLAYSWPHQITIKVTHRQVSACPKSFLITLKTDTQLYLEQTKLVCQRLALLGCFPICNIFPIIEIRYSEALIFWSMCLNIASSLFQQPGFCLIFILSKRRFLVWSLTENPSFVSFNGGL